MSDSVIISTAGSVQNMPVAEPVQPVVPSTPPEMNKPKPVQSGSGSSSKNSLPKPPPDSGRGLNIDILPLDEPMVEKISRAIDEEIYGSSPSPISEDEPLGNKVDVKV